MMVFLFVCLSVDAGDRFAQTYPSEVRVLKGQFMEIRGVAKLSTVKKGKSGPPKDFRFASGPDRRKFEFESSHSRSGKQSVNRYGYAELNERSIEVERTGSADVYSVLAIGDNDPTRRALFNALFGKYMEAPWAINGRDVEEAVARGWFSVVEAREIGVDGRDLIEVTFRLTTMAEPNYYQAVFDPSLHWAILRASRWTTDPEKPSERYEVTYGPTASGKPYMKTVRWWDRNGRETLCEFDAVEFATTPAAEFTLEHYGLKSPPLPVKGPNYRMAGWIAASAVGLLGAAWFLRRFATRTA